MKYSILIFMLAQPSLLWGEPNLDQRITGGTSLANSPTAGLNQISQHIGRMFHSPVAINTSRTQKKWHAGCSTFIQNDGTYGATGVMLLDELTAARHPALFSNDIRDFQVICPNWVNMDEPQRKAFLIYALAALANQESSCNAKSHTSRGEAGFLSLPFHRHSTVDVVCNSNPQTGAPNKNWAPLDGRANLVCGINFIKAQLEGVSPAQTRRLGVKMPVSRTFIALGSHFGPLRPFKNSGHGGAEKVRERLAEYTPCGTDYKTITAKLAGGLAHLRGFNTPVPNTPAYELILAQTAATSNAEDPRLASTPIRPVETVTAERNTAAATAAAN